MKRKMTIHLSPGSIGVEATQLEAIAYARQYGFEAVEANPAFLATLRLDEVDGIAAKVRDAGLVWGNAGLTVDFRKDSATFEAGLAQLPRIAKALQRAGVTRIGTWLSPSSSTLTYIANFNQ